MFKVSLDRDRLGGGGWSLERTLLFTNIPIPLLNSQFTGKILNIEPKILLFLLQLVNIQPVTMLYGNINFPITGYYQGI